MFASINEVNTIGNLSRVLLFDSRTLYVHGYLVYKYNSSTPASSDVPVFANFWAKNFWSDVKILKTASSLGGKSLGSGYVEYDGEEYVLAERDDHDSIYGVAFNFSGVQPHQEIRVDIWFSISISKIDMTGLSPENVGNVSMAREAVDRKYLNETYYWDYGNASVQKVIRVINETTGSDNIYDTIYGTIDWFSKNMVYREHEDYPTARLRASQILNETIFVHGETKRYGVCRHFADAFVAIMRGFGIPANLMEGLIFYDMGGSVGVIFSGGHAWCEVYLPNVGWVPVEVTISDKYIRDIVRVGIISPYYYLPIYKEFTNTELGDDWEAGEPEEYENLIPAYWHWAVGEAPALSIEGIIHTVVSTPVVTWILVVIVIALTVDSVLVRRKIKELARHASAF
jgi:transglutaminase-like putative cysteine protease